jgi:hypothetical protein
MEYFPPTSVRHLWFHHLNFWVWILQYYFDYGGVGGALGGYGERFLSNK